MPSYTRQVNKAQNLSDQVQSKEQAELYRFPSDQTYPASISYSLRRVIPLQEEAVRAILKKASELENNDDTPQTDPNETGSTYDPVGTQVPDKGPNFAARAAEKEKSEATAYTDVRTDIFGMKTAAVTPRKQVILYFPQSLAVNDGVQYNQAQLGATGTAALGALRNSGSLTSATAAAVEGAMRSITDLGSLLSGNLDLQKAGGALAVSRVANAMGTSGLAAAAQVGLQVKVNPNNRALFQGVNVRSFSFTYDFVPRSPEEAEEIHQIIKFFRTELYPSTPLNLFESGIPLGYRFPHLFEIKLRYNNDVNTKLPQPLYCYLRDVQTNFNPQSMSWHADGSPTQIQMTLNFTEYRTLRKEDIEAGQ